jgi:hypothetical protein
VAEYQYRIGTTAGGGQVVGWTSVGTATEVTRSGLHLTDGTTYYFSVKAKNGGGMWSAVGTSDGVTVFIGDFDGDCEVTVNDIMRVASRWDTSSGQAGYDPWYDLDSDGDIDVADIVQVASAWSNQCPGGAAGSGKSPAQDVLVGALISPTVYIAPSPILAMPGDVITATVMVTQTHNLAGFEFHLHFTPAVLTITQITVGSLLGSTGNTVVPLGGISRMTSDTVPFGAFVYGHNAGPDGGGALAVISASVLSRGQGLLQLQKVQLVDRDSQVQPLAEVKDGSVDSRLKVWLSLVLRR